MNIEYKENILTTDKYILFENKMRNPQKKIEQVERSLAHQLLSISAVKDNEIIGIARLLGDAAIYYYIEDVWVLPEHRGKGIGSKMIKALIQYVKETSITGTSVSLYVFSLKDKEGFYEKLGFLQRPHNWEGAGMEMELDIE